MKAFLVLAVVAGAALAAPTEDISTQDLQRTKKSAYGVAPSYAAPCAGAAPLAPVALYLSAAPQSAGLPHYREDEHKDEKMEQRSYYDSPAAASAGSAAVAAIAAPAAVAAPAVGGSAVGVFPSANVGNCAIPLLLSCAPNVVSGHLAHGSGYAAPAYRAHESEHLKDMREANEKAWSEAERTVGQHNVVQNAQAHASHHHHAASNIPHTMPHQNIAQFQA